MQLDFFNLKKKKLKLIKKTSGSNKEVLYFQEHIVKIQRRNYQRSINLMVKPTGEIKITCSKSCPKWELNSFIKKNELWLKKSIEKYTEQRKKYPKKELVNGESFFVLGKAFHLVFNLKKVKGRKKTNISLSDNEIIIGMNDRYYNESDLNIPHPEFRMDLLKFYEDLAKNIMNKRFEILSKQMQLFPKKVSYRAQNARWGSCSSQGHISMNWKLILSPMDCLDYVIIHELAHLKHQNHSARFWNLVDAHCPNYKNKKKWLKDNQYEFDFLNRKSEIYQD